MGKRQIIIIATFVMGLGLLIGIGGTGDLLKAQVSSPDQGTIMVCSHIECAETTDDGVSTDCRRTIVKCSSPNCNAGPCLASSISPASIKSSPMLVPVASSLQPVVSPTPIISPSSDEDPENSTGGLMIWQKLQEILISFLRLIAKAVITLFSQI